MGFLMIRYLRISNKTDNSQQWLLMSWKYIK